MRILITGGTNGMGKGLARALALDEQEKHEIIILCRSKKLGLSTLEDLQDLKGRPRVSIVVCDLSRLADVKKAIREIQDTYDYLDGIFINAGIGYAPSRLVTQDGMMAHFQVNYLAQFMLTLNMLDLLEKSSLGGRVVFNATQRGKIYWDDLQMEDKWTYEEGIHQAMVAKRMFLKKLHEVYKGQANKISFIGYQIPKTVWTNQIQIIPFYMRAFARVIKLFGGFISIETCGQMMVPLFTESWGLSQERSGRFVTSKDDDFVEIKEEDQVEDPHNQNRLWQLSLNLCQDEKTSEISDRLHK